MEIRTITPSDPLWSSYVAHLHCVNMARWIVDDKGNLLEPLHTICAIVDGEVVGNLSLKVQALTVPSTDWSIENMLDHTVRHEDGAPIKEAFVFSFAVDKAFRRQGIGRSLQLAALEATVKLGCIQMRSWSSLDKPANYALKLSMGFAAHPAVSSTPAGNDVSGVYFIKAVTPASENDS